ncbi:DUF502 domain-containing protein [Celeribacter sp.]|uniref:DUF502 domain-containing protein n=1 Tax=Celeribacter sp. TaxID=1890673 RepID=UPI003A941C70
MTNPFEEDTHPKHKRGGFFGWLRASFLTGLVVVAPIGLTAYVIWTVIGWVDGWALTFVPQKFQPEQYIGINLRGVGVILFLLFTIIVGWIAKGLVGRSLLRWAENLVDRTPIVRSIYNGAKQIAETVFAQSETSFDKACLIEYPRKGIWAVGFVSTAAKGEIAERTPEGRDMLSVFVPTTPNPTSGFLLFFPSDEVQMLDMTVEDAAKLVISAGLVYPNSKGPSAPESTPRP